MNRSFQKGNGQFNMQPAIPSSISNDGIEYSVPSFTYNKQAASTLKIVQAHMPSNGLQGYIKTVKPQQLLAGMVFSAFGLENLPLNAINNRIIYLANYSGQHAIELWFTQTAKKIKQVAKLVNNFNTVNGWPVKSETYKNSVAEYKSDLTVFAEDNDVVSFSKVIGEREIAIIYNTSETDAKENFILMHTNMGEHVVKISSVYGYDSCSHVHLFHGVINDKLFSYIKIYLKPLQLIVLKNY